MKFKKFFIGADPHVLMNRGRVAGVDLLTNNAVVSYLEAEGPWDGYVSLGDVYDLNVISDHNKGKLKLVEGQRLYDDYAAGNAYLTQHWTAAGKPAQFHLVEGNHENRVTRYIEAKPELDGFVNLEKHLPPFVKFHKFWTNHELLRIGKLLCIHGIDSGNNQCGVALRDYGCNVVMGHTHRVEAVAGRYHGDDETKIAQSIPCLCEYSQPYLKKRPTKWSQGFAVLHLWPNGNFNLHTILAFDHTFVAPSGKYYNGKKDRPSTKIIL